jgi:hypothetical protein
MPYVGPLGAYIPSMYAILESLYAPSKKNMGKIYRLDSFRKEKTQRKERWNRAAIQSGYVFSEKAVEIIKDELAFRTTADPAAVWYGLVRAGIDELRTKGWTEQDIGRLIKDSQSKK